MFCKELRLPARIARKRILGRMRIILVMINSKRTVKCGLLVGFALRFAVVGDGPAVLGMGF